MVSKCSYREQPGRHKNGLSFINDFGKFGKLVDQQKGIWGSRFYVTKERCRLLMYEDIEGPPRFPNEEGAIDIFAQVITAGDIGNQDFNADVRFDLNSCSNSSNNYLRVLLALFSQLTLNYGFGFTDQPRSRVLAICGPNMLT